MRPDINQVRTITKSFQLKETYQGPLRAPWYRLKEAAAQKASIVLVREQNASDPQHGDQAQGAMLQKESLTARFSLWSQAAGLALGDRAGWWGTPVIPKRAAYHFSVGRGSA